MNAAPPRKGSFLRTVQAVAWSLIGLRQHSAYTSKSGKSCSVICIRT